MVAALRVLFTALEECHVAQSDVVALVVTSSNPASRFQDDLQLATASFVAVDDSTCFDANDVSVWMSSNGRRNGPVMMTGPCSNRHGTFSGCQ